MMAGAGSLGVPRDLSYRPSTMLRGVSVQFIKGFRSGNFSPRFRSWFLLAVPLIHTNSNYSKFPRSELVRY